MTFKGSGMADLEKVLKRFPRDFTVDEIIGEFGWSVTRARQAIVNGQQTDTVRVIAERQTDGRSHAIFENTQWRKEWLMRAWHGTVVSSEQEAG